MHSVAWMLKQWPNETNAYVSYADRIARSKSRKAQLYSIAAGIQLDTTAANEWRTPEGGGLLAGGVGGPLVGYGIDGLAIIDDPYKSRVEAESAAFQQTLRDWWMDVLYTRLEVGSGCIVTHTRWTPSDLIGWLLKEFPDTWEHINLPALSEDEHETALWPERWSREALMEKRANVGAYTWGSIYQGRPRPRGGTVFGDPTVYEKRPVGFKVGIGIDLAYSSKKASDWSVMVVMGAVTVPVMVDGKEKPKTTYYVLDVTRTQVRPEQFLALLKAKRAEYPTARVRWYCSGTELGAGSFMRAGGVPVELIPTTADKFTRAIPYAAAWNRGEIQLPSQGDWLEDFVTEHLEFTGVKDPHDDAIDAGAAALSILSGSQGTYQSASDWGGEPTKRRM